MKTSKLVTMVSAVALLGLISTQGLAAPGYVQGRTTAIRSEIARWINAGKIAHVNYDIGSGKVTRTIQPSEVRFRSSRASSAGVDVHDAGWAIVNRASVRWNLRSGILRGTARATTPVIGDGGKLTQVYDIKTTAMPRGLPPAIGKPAIVK